MGTIKTQADDTFRDYNTAGIAASGPYEPPKPDVREVFETIDNKVSVLETTAGTPGLNFDTKAAMDADLAHAANTVAFVNFDATLANNGKYLKQGISGAGSWSKANDRVDAETTRATGVEDDLQESISALEIDASLNVSDAALLSGLPSGALGLWLIDRYTANPSPATPNLMSRNPVSKNLLRAPSRLFANGQFHGGSGTISDTPTAFSDGTFGSTISMASGQIYGQSVDLPAGEYTVAIDAQRNTGSNQTFNMHINGSPTASHVATATKQTFSNTFTLGSPATVGIYFVSTMSLGAGANLIIDAARIFEGDTDLGADTESGHIYWGNFAYDESAGTYANGEHDISDGGFGLIQFPRDITLETWTASAVVKKQIASTPGSGFIPGGTYQALMSKVQNYGQFAPMLEVSGTGPVILYDGEGDGTQNWPGEPSADFLGEEYYFLTWKYDGASAQFYINDIKFADPALSPFALDELGPVTIRDLFIGATNNVLNTTAHSLAGLVTLYDRALTDDEVRSLYRTSKTATERRVALEIEDVGVPLVADGTSITAGQPYCYTLQALPDFAQKTTLCSYAHSSTFLSQIVSRAPKLTKVMPSDWVPFYRPAVYSLEVGANDFAVVSPPTSAAYAATLFAHCDYVRALGFKVVLCTILPRDHSVHNTLRAEVNTLIKASVGVHCDAVCDWDDTDMGSDADALDIAKYPDGLHPSEAGHAILKEAYIDAVDSVS